MILGFIAGFFCAFGVGMLLLYWLGGDY